MLLMDVGVESQSLVLPRQKPQRQNETSGSACMHVQTFHGHGCENVSQTKRNAKQELLRSYLISVYQMQVQLKVVIVQDG